MSLYLPEIRVFLNSLLNFCKVVKSRDKKNPFYVKSMELF